MDTSPLIHIHTSLLFDPLTQAFLPNRTLTVDPTTGLITSLTERPSPALPAPPPPPHRTLDLRDLVVLPGFVDAHSHILLHAEYATPLEQQLHAESPTERIIRATAHARRALLAGFTTYRDLGSEGLDDADAHVRNAINRGLVPGPRMFVATRPLATSGGYALRGERGGALPRLADEADGEWGVRAAVRRRLAAGADVIKVYGDEEVRRMRRPEGPGVAAMAVPLEDDRPENTLLYTLAELRAIVDEAHSARCPVAVHAMSAAAVARAAHAGVDSIEHASLADEAALQAVKAAGCVLVPTLSVMEVYVPPAPFKNEMLPVARRAWELGIPLAAGVDSGPVPHGQNAREMELLVEAGVPVEAVLAAATRGGWRACGGDWCGRRFGWCEEGTAADLVGLRGDPRGDFGAVRRVEFVMRDGRVWKEGGRGVGLDCGEHV